MLFFTLFRVGVIKEFGNMLKNTSCRKHSSFQFFRPVYVAGEIYDN